MISYIFFFHLTLRGIVVNVKALLSTILGISFLNKLLCTELVSNRKQLVQMISMLMRNLLPFRTEMVYFSNRVSGNMATCFGLLILGETGFPAWKISFDDSKNDSKRYKFSICLQNKQEYHVPGHGIDSILRAKGQSSFIPAMQWEGLVEQYTAAMFQLGVLVKSSELTSRDHPNLLKHERN